MSVRSARCEGVVEPEAIGLRNLVCRIRERRRALVCRNDEVRIVAIVDARCTAGASGNSVYAKAIYQIRDDVTTGTTLYNAIKSTGLFPTMLMQMVSIGEESGALDDMLDKVATHFENEVDNAVDLRYFRRIFGPSGFEQFRHPRQTTGDIFGFRNFLWDFGKNVTLFHFVTEVDMDVADIAHQTRHDVSAVVTLH